MTTRWCCEDGETACHYNQRTKATNSIHTLMIVPGLLTHVGTKDTQMRSTAKYTWQVCCRRE